MKTIILLAAAAMTGLTATEVNAQTVAVSYADLATGTAAGRATLTQRVDAAVNFVCGVASAEQDLAVKVEIRKCHTAAMAQAMKAVEAKTAPQIASR